MSLPVVIVGKSKTADESILGQRVPLPAVLPMPTGFFLLSRARDSGRYTVQVDDADRTSYNLGMDPSQIVQQLRAWGCANVAEAAVDLAREFGRVQVIPMQTRVIPLHPRETAPVLDFKEDDDAAAGWTQLPNASL